MRSIAKLDGKWIYSICVLEGYSRKILAGMVSPYQDLVAVLQLLCAALSESGRPEGMVSDNGGAFSAHDYTTFLQALDIEPCPIEKGRPWQNLIEAQFLIQNRLADARFQHASSLEELERHHAEFIQTFNTTPHGAHRNREDGRRTPEAVLSWVRGMSVDLDYLRRLVQEMQMIRTVNHAGYISIQRFYL